MSRAPLFPFPALGRTLSVGARETVRLATGQLGRPTHIQVGSAEAELIWECNGRVAVRIALRRDRGSGLWQLRRAE
jgi:hypothetical protein